jgi:hypothetical protein
MEDSPVEIFLPARDTFPHPYGLSHAEAFIETAQGMSPATFFAIDIGGEAGGGIGYTLRHDVERISAEIGYWLGTAFWGRGIMTSAVDAVTPSRGTRTCGASTPCRTPGARLRCVCSKKSAAGERRRVGQGSLDSRQDV